MQQYPCLPRQHARVSSTARASSHTTLPCRASARATLRRSTVDTARGLGTPELAPCRGLQSSPRPLQTDPPRYPRIGTVAEAQSELGTPEYAICIHCGMALSLKRNACVHWAALRGGGDGTLLLCLLLDLYVSRAAARRTRWAGRIVVAVPLAARARVGYTHTRARACARAHTGRERRREPEELGARAMGSGEERSKGDRPADGKEERSARLAELKAMLQEIEVEKTAAAPRHQGGGEPVVTFLLCILTGWLGAMIYHQDTIFAPPCAVCAVCRVRCVPRHRVRPR